MPKLLKEVCQFFIGIDPGGSSGGASLLHLNGKPCECDGRLESIGFETATEHEIGEWIKNQAAYARACGSEIKAALEKVHSMPKQGVASSFKFGANYGLLRGLLIGYSIPFIEPAPQAWMKKLNCMTRGDKKVTLAKAHERWPQYVSQIKKFNADSLLIAEYLRLTELGR